MAMHALRQIRTAIRHLNPGQVRDTAGRPFRVGLAASSSEALAAMEDFLAPPGISRKKRLQLFEILHRIGDPGAPSDFEIVLSAEGRPEAPDAFSFHLDEPERTVRQVLRQREELSLALARRLPPFRKPVVNRIILEVSQENSLFALFTALPAVLPNIFTLGWAAGEFASDTAVLTVNQVRMAFLIAAASDRPVGYREQKTQIAWIIAGAFGWRALARELAGRIPFGGGLIPKAAIAYAGTWVAGLSLERYYRLGCGLTAVERAAAYGQALESGRRFARWALDQRGGRS
jgi:hypothetical protein